jgi:hypothetical protein
MLDEAKAQGALAGSNNAQLQRLRTIAAKLVPQTPQWKRPRPGLEMEVNLQVRKSTRSACPAARSLSPASWISSADRRRSRHDHGPRPTLRVEHRPRAYR